MKEKGKIHWTRFLALMITSSPQIFGHLVRIAHIYNTDGDYVLCSHSLKTKEIAQTYNGMNNAEEIRGIMDEWVYHSIKCLQ